MGCGWDGWACSSSQDESGGQEHPTKVLTPGLDIQHRHCVPCTGNFSLPSNSSRLGKG